LFNEQFRAQSCENSSPMGTTIVTTRTVENFARLITSSILATYCDEPQARDWRARIDMRSPMRQSSDETDATLEAKELGTWKLTIEYDGTRYYGWQEQKNSRTVAGDLRAAAESQIAKPVEIAGAGLTDAGVHALGQVARLSADAQLKRVDLLYGLNDRLPA